MAGLIAHEGHGFAWSNISYCCRHRLRARSGRPQSEQIRAALLSTSQARVTWPRPGVPVAGSARRASSAMRAPSGMPGGRERGTRGNQVRSAPMLFFIRLWPVPGLGRTPPL